MLTTGNQLRAARALAAMDQATLAGRAGVNINTIGSMEKRGDQILTSGLDKVKSVMAVLEAVGVEFLNHGRPGVRMRQFRMGDLVQLSEAGERAGNSIGLNAIGTVVEVGEASDGSGEHAVRVQYGDQFLGPRRSRDFRFASSSPTPAGRREDEGERTAVGSIGGHRHAECQADD